MSYTAAKAFSITKRVKIINKKEFIKPALDRNSESFVIYITALKIPEITFYLSRVAQIINDNLIQVAALQQDEALIKIPPKYADFSDVFLYNLAI